MLNKEFFHKDESGLEDSVERLLAKVNNTFGVNDDSGFIIPDKAVQAVKDDICLIEKQWLTKVLPSKQMFHGRSSKTTRILARGTSKYNIVKFMYRRLKFYLKYDRNTKKHTRMAYDRKAYREVCFMILAFLMHKYWHYTTRYEFHVACISALIEFFETYTKKFGETVEVTWTINQGDVLSVIEEVEMAPMSITREYLDLIDPEFKPKFDIVRISEDIFHDGEIIMMIHDECLKKDVIDKIMEKCSCKRSKAYLILKQMGYTREYGKSTPEISAKLAMMMMDGVPLKDAAEWLIGTLGYSRTKAYRILKEKNYKPVVK